MLLWDGGCGIGFLAHLFAATSADLHICSRFTLLTWGWTSKICWLNFWTALMHFWNGQNLYFLPFFDFTPTYINTKLICESLPPVYETTPFCSQSYPLGWTSLLCMIKKALLHHFAEVCMVIQLLSHTFLAIFLGLSQVMSEDSSDENDILLALERWYHYKTQLNKM